MKRRPRSDLLAAFAALTALWSAAPAAAQGGLSVAPARIDAEVRRGAVLPPVRLANDTGRRLAIHATVVVAGQGIDGLPVRRPAADATRRLARVSPARFTIGPGAARRVRIVVTGDRPLRGAGSYGVVVFSATDPGARSARGRTNVATRLRLGANLLLRFRGTPGRAEGRATGLRAEQAGRGRLRFTVGVRNEGRLHGSPASRLVVRRADGRPVLRKRFPTGAILPRAEREFSVLPVKTLPAGTYTARADVRLGGRRTHRTTRFILVGPDELPTAQLRIGALPVPHARAGEPVRVDLSLRNDGTAPARPAGVVAVGPLGGTPRQRVQVDGDPLAPGRGRDLSFRLDPVGPGDHELSVELRDGDRVIDRRTLVFGEQDQAGLWDRFRDWAAAHVELVLAGFGLLLLLLLVALVVLAHRTRRRMRALGTPSS